MSVFDSIIDGVSDLFDTVSNSPSLSKAATTAATALISKGSSKASGRAESTFGSALFKQSQLMSPNNSPPTPTKTRWGADVNSVDPSVIENKWNRLLRELVSEDNPTATTPGRAQKGYQ